MKKRKVLSASVWTRSCQSTVIVLIASTINCLFTSLSFFISYIFCRITPPNISLVLFSILSVFVSCSYFSRRLIRSLTVASHIQSILALSGRITINDSSQLFSFFSITNKQPYHQAIIELYYSWF